MKIAKGILLLSFSVFLTNCSKVSSKNVKTEGLYTVFNLHGDNQQSVVCHAVVRVGGATGTFVDLDNGDSLTCNDQPMLKRSDSLGQISYEAKLSQQTDPNYTITLHRDGEKELRATVVLPAKIENITPSSGAEVSKAGPLTTTWNPSSDPNDKISVSFSARAGNTAYLSTMLPTSEDPGKADLLLTGFKEDPKFAQVRTGTLTFKRHRSGVTDPKLDSTIEADQSTLIYVKLMD